VIESKGRIRKPDSKAVGKVLGQASALSTINGKKPTTRCASFFMLKATGAEGLIIDLPGDGTGLAAEFDELKAIAKCYAFFLDGPVDAGENREDRATSDV